MTEKTLTDDDWQQALDLLEQTSIEYANLSAHRDVHDTWKRLLITLYKQRYQAGERSAQLYDEIMRLCQQ